MSEIKFTRTITVEVVLSETPGKGEVQCDRLSDFAPDEVLAQEKNMPLSEWFKNTDYTLVEDDIEILSRVR